MNLEYLKTIKDRLPEFSDYVTNIIEGGYGWDDLRGALVSRKYYEEAISLGKEFLKQRGNIASGYIFLADTYEATGDIESALKVYEESFNNGHKLSTKLYQKYAELAQGIYDKSKVIDIYEWFLDRKKSHLIHKSFFEFLLNSGEVEHAEREGLRSIDLYDNKTYSIRFKLSDLYESKGEIDRAKSEIKYLISKNENNG